MSLNLTDHQLLLGISLGFYALELVLYKVIHALLNSIESSGGLTEEINALMNRVKGKEIMIFTGIYVGLLFLAKFYMWVFFLILGLQAISVMVDIMLLISLLQQKR
jgi:hypothetical protein